ncbi:unnamed protein product, partial [Scytosiphon promiscuus]
MPQSCMGSLKREKPCAAAWACQVGFPPGPNEANGASFEASGNCMTNQRIDWDKLRVFKVVAELGSMTSAAARLRESPPTVSRKIDELEEFLSSKLFTRSTRGMELTETGKTVLRYARQMEESANE